MNRAKTAFALLVVFFAGCAAERLLVVPPARADTAPQRWEYTCPYLEGGSRQVAEAASKFGAEGWEWSGVLGQAVCFKRPLP